MPALLKDLFNNVLVVAKWMSTQAKQRKTSRHDDVSACRDAGWRNASVFIFVAAVVVVVVSNNVIFFYSTLCMML
jgi:hypothetical protein